MGVESLQTLDEQCKLIKEKFAVYPEATNEIVQSLQNSNAIVFAPTTLHSSLTPTFITKNVASAYNDSKAVKICFANMVREKGKYTVSENIKEIIKYINFYN